MKFNQLGQIQWTKSYGSTSDEIFFDVVVSSGDSNLFVLGSTKSDDISSEPDTSSLQEDILLTKWSTAGAYIYAKYLGDPAGAEIGKSLFLSADDSVLYLAGTSASATYTNGGTDLFLITMKVLDDSVLSKRFFGGTGDEDVFDVAVPSTGFVHIAGQSKTTTSWTGTSNDDAVLVVNDADFLDGTCSDLNPTDLPTSLIAIATDKSATQTVTLYDINAKTFADHTLTPGTGTATLTSVCTHTVYPSTVSEITLSVGSSLSQTLTAFCSGSSLTYSVGLINGDSLPSWLSFNTGTRNL